MNDYPTDPPDLDWASCWIGDAVFAAIVLRQQAADAHGGRRLSGLAREQLARDRELRAERNRVHARASMRRMRAEQRG